MTVQIEKAYSSIAKLNLWFKVDDSSTLSLADITELIPHRWNYFKEQWLNVKQNYVKKIGVYSDPNRLAKDIDKFSLFIESQRNLSGNPLSNGDILFKYFTIFDNTSVLGLSLSNEEKGIIDKAIIKTRSYIRKDFVDIRSDIIDGRDYVADITATSDEDYNRVFDRSSVPSQLTINNYNLNLQAFFQQSIKAVDFILANLFSLESMSVDPFALAKVNANNPDVDISTYNSGNLKRFNYGESLQQVAARELGSSDRWIDIAIANGLKPPYIDEVGQKIPLLSNASGNQLNISKTLGSELNIDKLYINQVVLLKSSTYPFADQRIIKNIKEAPVSGEIIIEVDGDSDLDRYKISDNASIRVFKPSTINSGFLILIPSLEILPDDLKQDTPWFLRSKDESEKRQKIDLMIDDNGELNFLSSEDVQLSFALENAIQALKLKLSVESGELEKHTDYGIIPIQGVKNNEIDSIEDFLVSSIEESISKDSRYDRVETLKVTYFTGDDASTGVGFDVKGEVRLTGGDGTIPIAFKVNI